MGNICRSPTAEAVFRHAASAAGLSSLVYCDSAGTHNYHIGDPPDARSIAAARRRGYDMTPLRARQVGKADFSSFDLVLAMDRQNLLWLQRLQPSSAPAQLMLYGDLHPDFAGQDVPDPYYGGAAGFERVLDMAEAVSASLLARIRGGPAQG
jgi:protein-tyrosine phosphatase